MKLNEGITASATFSRDERQLHEMLCSISAYLDLDFSNYESMLKVRVELLGSVSEACNIVLTSDVNLHVHQNEEKSPGYHLLLANIEFQLKRLAEELEPLSSYEGISIDELPEDMLPHFKLKKDIMILRGAMAYGQYVRAIYDGRDAQKEQLWQAIILLSGATERGLVGRDKYFMARYILANAYVDDTKSEKAFEILTELRFIKDAPKEKRQEMMKMLESICISSPYSKFTAANRFHDANELIEEAENLPLEGKVRAYNAALSLYNGLFEKDSDYPGLDISYGNALFKYANMAFQQGQLNIVDSALDRTISLATSICEKYAAAREYSAMDEQSFSLLPEEEQQRYDWLNLATHLLGESYLMAHMLQASTKEYADDILSLAESELMSLQERKNVDMKIQSEASYSLGWIKRTKKEIKEARHHFSEFIKLSRMMGSIEPSSVDNEKLEYASTQVAELDFIMRAN